MGTLNRPFIEAALHSLQHDVYRCVCEMHERPNMNQHKNVGLYSTCGVQQPFKQRQPYGPRVCLELVRGQQSDVAIQCMREFWRVFNHAIAVHESDATVMHDPPPALRQLRDVDSWTMKEVPGGEQGDLCHITDLAWLLVRVNADHVQAALEVSKVTVGHASMVLLAATAL